jgi:hypothetical protein
MSYMKDDICITCGAKLEKGHYCIAIWSGFYDDKRGPMTFPFSSTFDIVRGKQCHKCNQRRPV